MLIATDRYTVLKLHCVEFSNTLGLAVDMGDEISRSLEIVIYKYK
jgi:hypothetical protein